MQKPTIPVIVLAFANENTSSGFLSSLSKEMKQILMALEPAVQKGKIHIKILPAATQDEIISIFQDAWYEDRIWIFHYGGHADQDELWLETSDGENKSFFADGLSQFLGVQEGLKLVFLNACATEDHATLLLKESVPAVIATSRKIADNQALEFSKVFYRGLSAGSNIDEAYKEAQATLLGIYNKSQFKLESNTRSLFWENAEEGQKFDFPWRLFLKEGASWFPAQWKLFHELEEREKAENVSPDVFVGTTINETYEITKFLGQGRLGAVFIANHMSLNEERAIKVTHPITKGYDLFKSVVLAGNKGLSSIKHPNVVDFYDVGEFEFYGQKRLYMVMELMKGDRLDKADLSAYREDLDQYRELMLDLAAGLEAAHKTSFEDEAGMPREGIIHGNLKTRKLYFSAKGVPKINDFLFSDFSRSRQIKMKLPNDVIEKEKSERLELYFPPEVLEGKTGVNKQTDIFGFGSIMFEILTEENMADFDFVSVDDLDRYLGKKFRTFPKNISKVIFRATQKNPEKRYKAVSELIEDLLIKTGIARKIKYWFRRK